MSVTIEGLCPPEFAAVEEAFAHNFAQGEELGACFSVFINGQSVIDIRGGHCDKKKTRPWTDDTITCVFSSGKAILAYLIAVAVNDGELDYEAPVVNYWPEFGANGKDKITLAQVLSHQAGLPGIPDEMDPALWLNWEGLVDRLAQAKPLWTPGTGSGYHPQTFGHLGGEVYRRAMGKSVGEAIAAYNLPLHCGLGTEHIENIAYMQKPPKAPDLGEMNEFTKIAFLKPWSSPASNAVTREDWMSVQIPASNMHANARGLAEFLHPLANQGKTIKNERVLSQTTLAAFVLERTYSDDLVLPFKLAWAAGMMRNENYHFGPNRNALGQSGFGGSAVVVDPDHHMTISYVMNKMSPYLVGDPRSLRLIHAVYESF